MIIVSHTEIQGNFNIHGCLFMKEKVMHIFIYLYGFFFNLVCEAIGTAATPGLLCQPRVIVKMIMGKQMECRLAGET
jgi:hypothetical protein